MSYSLSRHDYAAILTVIIINYIDSEVDKICKYADDRNAAKLKLYRNVIRAFRVVIAADSSTAQALAYEGEFATDLSQKLIPIYKMALQHNVYSSDMQGAHDMVIEWLHCQIKRRGITLSDVGESGNDNT